MFNRSRWANNCTVPPLFYICCYGAFFIMIDYSKKDYSKTCEHCKHRCFSHCDNEKGKNYIPESIRSNTDNLDMYDTCGQFETRKK